MEYLQSVFQVVIGLGILGALVAYALRETTDKRQRRRELNGLLRLVDLEIGRNQIEFESFENYPRYITEAPDYTLSSAAWEACRVRISALLKNERLFSDIGKYYLNLHFLDNYRSKGNGSDEDRQKSLSKILPIMEELSVVIRQEIQKYVSDTHTSGTPLETAVPDERTRVIEDLNRMFRELERRYDKEEP